MTEQVKARTSHRQRSRKKRGANTVHTIIPGRAPLGFQHPASKSLRPVNRSAARAHQSLEGPQLLEGNNLLKHLSVDNTKPAVSLALLPQTDLIISPSGGESVKAAAPKTTPNDDLEGSNMAPTRPSMRSTLLERTSYDSPDQIQAEYGELDNFDTLASSQPIPLSALSSRQLSKNKGSKTWKPFQLEDYKKEQELDREILAPLSEANDYCYARNPDHEAHLKGGQFFVGQKNLARESEQSNMNAKLQRNSLSWAECPYQASPSCYEQQHHRHISYNTPFPNDSNSLMIVDANSLRNDPFHPQLCQGDLQGWVHFNESHSVAKALSYSSDRRSEALYGFPRSQSLTQQLSNQHHRHESAALSHNPSSASRWPVPEPEGDSRVNFEVPAAVMSSSGIEAHGGYPNSGSKQCKTPSMLLEQAGPLVASRLAETTGTRRTTSAYRIQHTDSKIRDTEAGANELEKGARAITDGKTTCNNSLRRAISANYRDGERLHRSIETGREVHGHAVQYNTPPHQSTSRQYSSDANVSPLMQRTLRTRAGGVENPAVYNRRACSLPQSFAPNTSGSLAAPQLHPAMAPGQESRQEQTPDGHGNSSRNILLDQKAAFRTNAPKLPPGLPPPGLEEAIWKLPKPFRLKEANDWFHADNRGEDHLREQIKAIAEGNAQIPDSSPLKRDRAQVKQTNLLVGNIIVNLFSYVSGNREAQVANFAPFRDVPSRYCEPRYGGRRSYFDQDPSAAQWKYPRVYAFGSNMPSMTRVKSSH